MPRKTASRKKKKSAINPLVAVLVTGVVLLVLFVSALLFAKSAVRGWLKGDEFRDWLVRKASLALRADVELAETDWQGAEIYSDSFIAEGYEDAGFSKLSLDGIRARTGGVEQAHVGGAHAPRGLRRIHRRGGVRVADAVLIRTLLVQFFLPAPCVGQ